MNKQTLQKTQKKAKVRISRKEHVHLKFFSLENYRQIKTPFGFVDESGLLNVKSDPYFALGLLKTHRASTLYPLIRSHRCRHEYYAELKFNKLSIRSLPLAIDVFTSVLESDTTSFSSIIIPKHDEDFDPEAYFSNDFFLIYKKFLVLLLKENIGPIEILTVLADDYFTPNDKDVIDTFEGGIRAIVNDNKKRLAMTGICQINSKSNDFIQIVDLMLGCVMLDLKIQKGMVDVKSVTSTKALQIQLLEHLKKLLQMEPNESFFIKNGNFNRSFLKRKPSFKVRIFDPKKAVHIIEKSEPSSIRGDAH
jgi:hypothetical protein